MSLRLAALWFDGSSPVVKVGVDSGPPLRAAGNLASNAPTPHAPDKAQPWLQDRAPEKSILKDNDTTGCKNVENSEWEIKVHLHRCYLHHFMKSGPDPRLLSELFFNVISLMNI